MSLTALGQLALSALWVALPVTIAAVSHMFVVKKDLFSWARRPLDGGRCLGGERWLGDNKTWRGVLWMSLAAMGAGAGQGLLAGDWAAASGLLPGRPADWGVGAGRRAAALAHGESMLLLGLGYVLGELPNSFLKRRLAIAPGRTAQSVLGLIFFLVDQADSVVCGIGLAALLYGWGWRFFLVALATLTLLHLGFNVLLYGLRVRRNL